MGFGKPIKKDQPKGNKQGRQGSSIVEVIVALVLFATFIAGSCKAILNHRQVADQARAHYTAINIAKNQIEQIRHLRKASFDQIFELQEENVQVNAQGEPDTEFGQFSRNTTITRVDDFLLEIEVEVKIKDRNTLLFDGEKETLKSFMARLISEE